MPDPEHNTRVSEEALLAKELRQQRDTDRIEKSIAAKYEQKANDAEQNRRIDELEDELKKLREDQTSWKNTTRILIRRSDEEIREWVGGEDDEWVGQVDEMLEAFDSIAWAWRILKKYPKLAKWVSASGLGGVLAVGAWALTKLGFTLPG